MHRRIFTWLGRFIEGLETTNIEFTRPIYGDYLTSGLSLRLGASAPDLAEFRDGLFLLGFDGAATSEQAFFSVHILHDIAPDTNPTFHVHWTHNVASPSGNVKWFIDYAVAKGYGAGSFPAPTTLNTVQAAGAQYEHHITNDDDMVVTEDLEPDTLLICRVYRTPGDAEDTFANDAFLVNIDCHYQIGQIGTEERNRPFARFE